MLCRYARLAASSRRGPTFLRPAPSLAVLAEHIAITTLGDARANAAARASADGASSGVGLIYQSRAGLSAVATKAKEVTEEDGVMRTPPVEEEDTGPPIRELRVQLRPESEQGSRGARRVRKVGKIPGVVYSNNTASGEGARGEPFFVKVDKLVVDREIRRLNASFDNTVYDLVIEGAKPAGDDEEGVRMGKVEGARGEGRGEATVQEEGVETPSESVVDGVGREVDRPERRELVLANECRLHPVFRNVLSVNWMRYKAGRKYPIPIKFINDDLNDNFRKGAYIRRLKSHQHILLPEDPEKVPKWLYLDLEFVRSGSKLRVSDVIVPEGIRFFRGNEPAMWNEVVCTIKGRKLFVSDKEEDEE